MAKAVYISELRDLENKFDSLPGVSAVGRHKGQRFEIEFDDADDNGNLYRNLIEYLNGLDPQSIKLSQMIQCDINYRLNHWEAKRSYRLAGTPESLCIFAEALKAVEALPRNCNPVRLAEIEAFKEEAQADA